MTDIRFKDLYCLPKEKHAFAWECLLMEYTYFSISTQPKLYPSPSTSTLTSPTSTMNAKSDDENPRKKLSLFEEYLEQKPKSENMEVIKADEFTSYKSLTLSSFEVRADPLKWWKEKEKEYPTLALVARLYLSIPASQATCERSFSLSRRICSDARTSLSPDHLEKLTVMKKNCYLDLVEYETLDDEEKFNESRADEGFADHLDIIPLIPLFPLIPPTPLVEAQPVVMTETPPKNNSNSIVLMDVDIPRNQTKSPGFLIRNELMESNNSSINLFNPPSYNFGYNYPSNYSFNYPNNHANNSPHGYASFNSYPFNNVNK